MLCVEYEFAHHQKGYNMLQPCNGCGYKKPEHIEINETRHLVKCLSCGMNTGLLKSKQLVVDLWNQNMRKQHERDS